jgi:hypothetical protein
LGRHLGEKIQTETPHGRKGFTLDDTFERRRRLYIGDFPGWSVVAAHERQAVKRAVDQRSIFGAAVNFWS